MTATMVRTLIAVLIAGISQGEGSRSTGQGKPGEVLVEVVDVINNSAIQGARVFVLSEGGRELASAITDDLGGARLSIVTGPDKPKYILAEHRAFFVSGRRWVPEATRYIIHTSILVIR